MIHFHYCTKYRNKVTPETDRVVRNRLKNLEKRDDLNNIRTHGWVSVLQTHKPTNMRTIIQRMDITVKQEQTLPVYFVQDIVDVNDQTPYREVRRGLWGQYYPISEEDKNDFLKTYNQSKGADTKEDLPATLKDWTQDFRVNINTNIYETESWVKFAYSESHSDGMPLEDVKSYYYTLKKILNEEVNSKKVIIEFNNVKILEQVYEDYHIIYSKISIEDKIYYLLHNGFKNNQETYENKIRENLDKYKTDYSSIDDISKNAVRAYPDWLVQKGYDDLWKNIQKSSDNSNLSLLAEQTDYLRKFRFPSYIDAQAGSGKSTMLYYLFANAYYYRCVGEINGNIIFLTENEALLESTKKAVRDLLLNNSEFNGITQSQIIEIDKHFSTLKQFLLSLVAEDPIGNDKFNSDKYLDFSKFKIKYQRNPLNRRYTAEFCWFVINTIIRGYDVNREITSNDYDSIIKRDMQDVVSISELEAIEKSVLPFYNRLLREEGWWDKIEIIKFISENKGISELYEVLFCDEAQDFSRVELDFILNLSEYLQYNCGDFKNIPIVFAGDALQTVNPTGFRKADVKDLFYNQLNVKLKENEYKPKHNYRSTQAIVNIANSIQNFRKELGARVEYPQKAKQRQEEHDAYMNYFLSFDIVNNPQKQRSCLQNLEHKNIIVPCNAEEKTEYIQDNPFLEQFRDFANKNIKNEAETNGLEDFAKSPIEAKGLDYPQVIIYGFGAYCIKELGKYQAIDKTSYETQFFFNKLYVAVTRAQEELIIIDSEEAYNSFWMPLLNDYANSNFKDESQVNTEAIKNSIQRADETTRFKQGTPDIALENAKKDKERALLDKNPTLVRMAGAQFLRLGYKKEYYECKAIEAEFLGEYKTAGTFYEKKDMGEGSSELAADMYWKGKYKEEFKRLYPYLKETRQKIRMIILHMLKPATASATEIRSLRDNKQQLHEILRDTSWKAEIISEFINFSQNLQEPEAIKDLIDVYIEINDNQPLFTQELGRLQYKVGRFTDAVKTWEMMETQDENALYLHAQSEIAKSRNNYVDYIYWLGILDQSNNGKNIVYDANTEIIHVYEKYKQIISNTPKNEVLLFIYGSYLQKKPDDNDLLNLAQKIENLFSTKREILIDYYYYLLNHAKLHDSIVSYVTERWAKNAFLINESIDKINADYKRFISQLHNQTFTPFAENDLHKIDILPQYIIPKRSEHIQTVKIGGFRKFHDITIENLGLFNLVVGDNNIGKTSLLEAFLFTEDKQIFLKRLAFAHIDRKNIIPENEEKNGQFIHIFNMDETFLDDFKNYHSDNFNLTFSFRENRHQWEYQLLKSPKEPQIGVQQVLFEESDYKVLARLNLLDNIGNPFIPYGKGFGADLAEIYSEEISKKGRNAKKAFIERVKLFIEEIDEIEANPKTGEILVYEKGRDLPNALHQYGEGANKIFRILLFLTLHKGKRLMIDEIDAGIHHSRFIKFWKTILEIAMKDNTQIIASTHNEECIAYFIESLDELGQTYKDEARVIQGKNVAGKLKMQTSDYETFKLFQELAIDLRGGGIL